jgi:hypothetical protein
METILGIGFLGSWACIVIHEMFKPLKCNEERDVGSAFFIGGWGTGFVALMLSYLI